MRVPKDCTSRGSTEICLIVCEPNMLTCEITYILFFISLKITLNISLHFEVVVGGDGVQIRMIMVKILNIQLWTARQCGCCSWGYSSLVKHQNVGCVSDMQPESWAKSL